MKKLFLFIVLAAMIMPAKVFAQGARWGVKGGLNIAQESTDEGSTDSRIGIHLGATVEFPMGRGWDIQPELLYSMQGGKYKWQGETTTDKIDYISLPVMFKIYVNKERRKFSIDVGPTFGYMISMKVSDGSTSVSYYDLDGLNKFELGLGAGVTYKVNDNFDLVLRLTGGLTNLGEYSEHKNNGIQLGVGYRF